MALSDSNKDTPLTGDPVRWRRALTGQSRPVSFQPGHSGLRLVETFRLTRHNEVRSRGRTGHRLDA
jgi:hypothetical protein